MRNGADNLSKAERPTSKEPALPLQGGLAGVPDYELVWNDFWASIVTNQDGSLNLDQVKRELFDFHTAMHNVGEVYCHITGNRISKINTLAASVIAAVDDYSNSFLQPARPAAVLCTR